MLEYEKFAFGKPAIAGEPWLEDGKQDKTTGVPKSNSEEHMGMDQYLLIPFVGG